MDGDGYLVEGMPAVSRSGARIAVIESTENNYERLQLTILRASNGRSIRTRILYNETADDPAATAVSDPGLGRFRSMVRVEDVNRPSANLRGDALVLVVEGDRIEVHPLGPGAVIWQRQAPPPPPSIPADEEDMGGCNWDFAGASAWWDPPTGTLLVSYGYTSAGDWCDDPTSYFVDRIPAHRP